MSGKAPPRSSRPVVVSALLFLALGLQLPGAPPASAAKPPQGRTYFTALLGIEEAYDIRYQCFEVTATELCSLDGELCGSWQRTENRGKETSFSFELSFLEDGAPVTLDGHARVTSTGSGSSVGGAGSQLKGGRQYNFSFLGREASRTECLDLLRASSDPDGERVEGSGNLATESREVSDFHSVLLSGVGRLIIEHTGSESLTVTADDNLLPLLTSEVVDGQLRLASEGSFSTRNPITYRLSVVELDGISLSGAAGVEATGIDTEVLELTLVGASAAVLAGAVDRQIVDLKGACAYQGADLDSRVATVDISGASVAVVRVRELLEGIVAGASILEYFGNPAVNVTVSGPGTVRRRGD